MSSITAELLLQTLPPVLKADAKMRALAQATAEQLANLCSQSKEATLYARIDELGEEALDRLAYDYKVDWWDKNYTLAEKRATLKKSWQVHRQLGTKKAVEDAISAIYPQTTVKEWSEYAGAPFHFKLLIPVDITALDPSKHQRVLDLVAFYKNLRSVLDVVEYFGSGGTASEYAAAAATGCAMTDGATALRY